MLLPSSSPTSSLPQSLPLPILLTTLSLTFFPLLFFTFTQILFPIHFAPTQTKRRAWILSGTTAFIMTFLGSPFVWDFVRSVGDVGEMNRRRNDEAGGNGREVLGQMVCCGYLGFLVADLVLGRIFYREHMTYLRATGYIHHPVYAIIMVVALSTDQTYVFGIASLLELPSFFSSLSNINLRFRNDILFSAMFFVTRVAFHSWVCWAFVREWARGGDVGLTGVFFLCLALPLHIHWFRASVKGILRRRKLRRSTVVKSLHDAAASTALLFEASTALGSSRLQF